MSLVGSIVALVSEPHRQPARSREKLAELTLIVRPHWSKVRAFTDAQLGAATAYAAEVGGHVEHLD